jgi:hypothetical protein
MDGVVGNACEVGEARTPRTAKPLGKVSACQKYSEPAADERQSRLECQSVVTVVTIEELDVEQVRTAICFRCRRSKE